MSNMNTLSIDSTLTKSSSANGVILGLSGTGTGIMQTFCTLSSNATVANTTTYLSATGTNVTEASTRRLILRTGEIRRLAVRLDAATGIGAFSRIVTMRLNGVNTALTVTFAGAVDVFLTSTGSIAVSPGDVITVQCSVTGSPPATNITASIEIFNI